MHRASGDPRCMPAGLSAAVSLLSLSPSISRPSSSMPRPCPIPARIAISTVVVAAAAAAACLPVTRCSSYRIIAAKAPGRSLQ